MDGAGNPATDVGSFTSIAIGADGNPLIAYYDTTNTSLKVAHCDNAACTQATSTTLDSDGLVGQSPSIAIGADGYALVAYYDTTNTNLKMVHCTNTACTTFGTPVTLDATGAVGENPAIAIGADGLGLIAYTAGTPSWDLKVAHCNQTACTTATTGTADATQEVGLYPAIAIGADGFGLISHYDNTNGALRVVHCTNADCTSTWDRTVVDTTGTVGLASSVAIGADGYALIAYNVLSSASLKAAHCTNTACTTSSAPVTLATGSVGLSGISIVIGRDGHGLIAYPDENSGDLKAAHCTNTACSAATLAMLDSPGNVGGDPSLAIGVDGRAIIAYSDATNGNLKVAHCSSLACIPYQRTG